MWRTINLTSGIPYSDSFVTWGSHKQIRITRMPTELIYTFSMAFVVCFFCLVIIIKQSMIYLYTCYTLNQNNLTYCQTDWHFCKAVNIRKLERDQEHTLRAVFNSKTVVYEQFLNWADIPSLENRRLQDILILMYKVMYNLIPKSISDIFWNYDKKYNLCNVDFPWRGLLPYISHIGMCCPDG